MARLIENPRIRAEIVRLEAAVGSDERSRRALGRAIVAALRRAPIVKGRLLGMRRDTGRMQSSYFVRISRGRLEIWNRARAPKTGFPYPVVIEKRYDSVLVTLRQSRAAIIRDARRRLARMRPRSVPRGRLSPGELTLAAVTASEARRRRSEARRGRSGGRGRFLVPVVPRRDDEEVLG